MAKIKVIVNGAAGKMGLETVKAISNADDLDLAGVCDVTLVDAPIKDLVKEVKNDLKIQKSLTELIKSTKAQVVVDFTHPHSALENVKAILENGAHAVVGTTGLSMDNLEEIKKACSKNNVNCIVAPNFAIGAVLMMKFSKEAARYMPEVEIIEMHHDQKADAPSGTAIKTAELILSEINEVKRPDIKEIEKVKGVRGGSLGGINIHSVRLKGYVASQEVIFGGLGQTLKIRHDSINRASFMPGVVLAIREVTKVKGLVYGLENLM
ncbi:MAG: 4-hydroxy-tetrahydrodipicolinate reductase [Candidatus Margulisbacteria bacterium]|nr:4-hydroxy-tetrahydrodipicolinate reductase [Candidatus Margulisiibacteriota bacterium]MBU1021822.1 4-hydroxy-tetrahydrodipicolinate reductase [Candidatus Margulisiibacteriota bacterium]MBU1728981.1 4-hydroxy-tetrahydrodipicolinate reductase [Candidatus Margulisiibacteriota bacterium]MBU1954466.1 4-hydroxy-tetrahydrodipicolinate reductase [Candidatus Margulisiibacteriota bacterium]